MKKHSIDDPNIDKLDCWCLRQFWSYRVVESVHNQHGSNGNSNACIKMLLTEEQGCLKQNRYNISGGLKKCENLGWVPNQTNKTNWKIKEGDWTLTDNQIPRSCHCPGDNCSGDICSTSINNETIYQILTKIAGQLSLIGHLITRIKNKHKIFAWMCQLNKGKQR